MPESDAVIRDAADLDRLLLDDVPESLQLEYKSGRPKNKDKFKDDIAQDVSAFANSAGGTLIIGIVEERNRPVHIDGVDERQFSRESLGQLLASKIQPDIPGLRIQAICTSNNQTALVVAVPASRRAPHQGPNHKYYRRYEFHNQPMAHHEIEDIRRRQISVAPLVLLCYKRSKIGSLPVTG